MDDDDWLDKSANEEEADIKTYSKIEKDRIKDGFRAGLEAGKESVLQEGFNKGYILALDKCRELSKIRGILNALICHSMMVPKEEQKPISTENVAKIEDMVEELSNTEKLVSSSLCTQNESSSCCQKYSSAKEGCSSDQENQTSESIVNFDEILLKANGLIGDLGLLV